MSSEPIDHVAMVAFDADDVLGAYRGLVADDDAELPERVLAYVREHADRIERPLARRGLEILDDLVDEALTRSAQAPDAEIVDELGGF